MVLHFQFNFLLCILFCFSSLATNAKLRAVYWIEFGVFVIDRLAVLVDYSISDYLLRRFDRGSNCAHRWHYSCCYCYYWPPIGLVSVDMEFGTIRFPNDYIFLSKPVAQRKTKTILLQTLRSAMALTYL